jgi:hypothetical protein
VGPCALEREQGRFEREGRIVQEQLIEDRIFVD